jgi:alpha-ribazole phosphatase
MVRCAMMADLLAASLGALCASPVTVRPDPRLRELDFGEWEGRRWDSLGPDDFEPWLKNFASHPVGGGESVQQVMDRVGSALEETLRQSMDTDCLDAIWVTHAGVIRAASLHAMKVHEVAGADQWPVGVPEFGEGLTVSL